MKLIIMKWINPPRTFDLSLSLSLSCFNMTFKICFRYVKGVSLAIPFEDYCYFVMDLVNPQIKDLNKGGGIEDEETGCRENAPVFGMQGSYSCQLSWAKALLQKAVPITDGASGKKYYENPVLLDRLGADGVKEINGWTNRIHVSNVQKTVRKVGHSYVIVVGDADRSGLYDSGSGVLGAREKIGLVYEVIREVIRDGESEIDLERIRNNIEIWKGTYMAMYVDMFITKYDRTQVDWARIDSFNSGKLDCHNTMNKLITHREGMGPFKVVNGGGGGAGGDAEVALRFVENSGGKEVRRRRRLDIEERPMAWGDVWGI